MNHVPWCIWEKDNFRTIPNFVPSRNSYKNLLKPHHIFYFQPIYFYLLYYKENFEICDDLSIAFVDETQDEPSL